MGDRSPERAEARKGNELKNFERALDAIGIAHETAFDAIGQALGEDALEPLRAAHKALRKAELMLKDAKGKKADQLNREMQAQEETIVRARTQLVAKVQNGDISDPRALFPWMQRDEDKGEPPYEGNLRMLMSRERADRIAGGMAKEDNDRVALLQGRRAQALENHFFLERLYGERIGNRFADARDARKQQEEDTVRAAFAERGLTPVTLQYRGKECRGGVRLAHAGKDGRSWRVDAVEGLPEGLIRKGVAYVWDFTNAPETLREALNNAANELLRGERREKESKKEAA